MSKHHRGGKINASHTTATEAAAKLIKAAEKLPEVTKISLGYITNGLPSGSHRVKFTLIQGGLRADIRGTRSKQEIFIYTAHPFKTQHALQRAFNT